MGRLNTSSQTTPRSARPHTIGPVIPRALWKRFGFYDLHQQKLAQQKVAAAHEQRPSAPAVAIAYRDDGRVRGAGANFDHRTLQLLGKTGTVVANFTEGTSHLSEYLQNHAGYRLPYARAEDEAVPAPTVVTNLETLDGLLFLPGVPRSVKDSAEQLAPRSSQNNILIRDAINRGKPILAVCGGSWALWQYFGGELVPVKDHCSARMPSINRLGKVGYNIQIHRITLEEKGHILKGAMRYEQNRDRNPNPAVNSVHWLSPGGDVPDMFDVSARSQHDPALAPMGRHQAQMHPEEGTIECFESRSGAPILGVVWHPEAYTSNTNSAYFPKQHQAIIQYMIEASRTYQLKQILNQEFLACLASQKPMLRKVSANVDTPMREAHAGAAAAPPPALTFWQKEYLEDQVRKARIESVDGVTVEYEEREGALREVINLS